MRTILPFLLLLSCLHAANRQTLAEPSFETFTDETEVITLAQNEKFSLPITTRTITHRLETLPENSEECQFVAESMLYRPVATAALLSGQDEEVVAMLALRHKEKLFLADQNHNLLSYSLDEHYPLKRLAPKTSILPGGQSGLTTIALVATEDEQYVYYLTPTKYYIFQSESLGSEILQQGLMEGGLVDIQKAIVYKGYLLVLSRQAGPLIYRMDKTTRKLSLAQSLIAGRDLFWADMQFERSTEMLYLLAMNAATIRVFHFEPSQFPESDKSFHVFSSYDTLNIEEVTNRHGQSDNEQRNVHLDLQVSSNRQEQSILVLFLHNYHNVIVEVSYQPVQLTWAFVRYFKFSMRVNQIKVIADLLAVVGSESMGVFPFGIHPRLIDEEMNGVMTLSSVARLEVLSGGLFVGVTKNSVEMGSIGLDARAELSCKIREGSKLKSVKLRANLTACSSQDRFLYENYCAYEKTFLIEEMQLAVSAPMADSLWTAMLLFLLLIVLGVCMLFAMQQRKEREIKRLELYFEEKRREPPPSSDRRTLEQM